MCVCVCVRDVCVYVCVCVCVCVWCVCVRCVRTLTSREPGARLCAPASAVRATAVCARTGPSVVELCRERQVRGTGARPDTLSCSRSSRSNVGCPPELAWCVPS